MSYDLAGKTVIITGGASGIGAAATRLFVVNGAKVVVGDVDEARLESMANDLGDSVRTVVADVRMEAGVRSLVDSAVSNFGRLDVLVNNAAKAIEEDRDILSSTDDAWRETFDMILMAALWGARHAIPVMRDSNGGVIINVSSGAAAEPMAAKAAYGACKAGLEIFTRYTAGQYGSDNIRCNAVRAGFVMTEAIEPLFTQEQIDQMRDQYTLGRVCQPDEVAQAIVWLASPAASYVSGLIVTVNGGGPRPTASY